MFSIDSEHAGIKESAVKDNHKRACSEVLQRVASMMGEVRLKCGGAFWWETMAMCLLAQEFPLKI